MDNIIEPQPGPQTQFLSTDADIAIYGGAAGGGKSFGLLLDLVRHEYNRDFGAVIFRKNAVQIRNQGGLWDESYSLYYKLGYKPRETFLEWTTPWGAAIKFAHLEHEKTVYDYQGAQIPMLGFDELTHFSEAQFFYMLSRNRSMSGVPGYCRSTCNPDADSWVRKFIDWWIGEDGFPIPERSGIKRWFIRDDNVVIWGDTREELINKFETPDRPILPMSVTFIAAKIQDNKILMQKDPTYLAKLHSLPRIERLRLLGGNWNIRATAGMYFEKEWFPIIDGIPAGWIDVVRYWDRAATKPNTDNPNPDWTVGLLMYKYPDATFVIGDVRRTRDTPLGVEKYIKGTAAYDGQAIRIVIEQDPGQAGIADAENYVRLLSGYQVKTNRVDKDKETRALPVSAQAEHGNIRLKRGPWNEPFLIECESFPPTESKSRSKDATVDQHDDQVDTLSGAFNDMAQGHTLFDLI